MSKYIKDFKSQVTCLPGPVKNNDSKEIGKLMSDQRMIKTDIFFHKKSGDFVPEKKKFVKKNIGSNEVYVVHGKSTNSLASRNRNESQIFK